MLVTGDLDHQPAQPSGGGARPSDRKRQWRRGFATAAAAGGLVTCAMTPAMAGTVSPSVRPASTTDQHILRGVSALSATDAWTVGLATDANGYHTLTRHWDGTHWKRVASPNPGGAAGSFLLGVDAVSTDDVWAVGNTGVEPTPNTLIEHWNGKRWSALPSRSGELYDVAAVSPDDVWAVGNYYENQTSHPLIMHWNGKRWSTVDTPPQVGHLYGVSAVSSDDVWVSGFFFNGTNNTLVEHWDGKRWSVVESPSPKSFNELYGISAVSTDDVWAVGDYAAKGGQKALIEHWDGTRWSRVRNRIPPSGSLPFLFDVDAVSPSQVWAAGFRLNSGESLVERWNGTKWAQVSSPSGNGMTTLWSVDATSGKDAWTVGSVTNELGGTTTLIEHWDGDTWSVVDG